ncbi:hypothetical protein HY490_02155, partial [Candidatus Woesearchaeota archaeon]|nr:hypothetical protein [Candidatus Woesearchaeota archaeon]
LGDVEAGVLVDTGLGRIRVAGRVQPEAYVARVGLAGKAFDLDARYGVGRHGPFTPDFVEVRAGGRLPITDSVGVDASVSGRHEQWSHGEQNTEGTATVQVKVDF